MTVLVYGAYGYTGQLVSDELVERGVDVLVAGRNAEAVAERADVLGVPGRAFPVEETGSELGGVDVVLNCAGPFVDTAEAVADACVETGTDYLDVTGEIPAFEALADRDDAARKAGVTVLPGVGFDVVPTDCLARVVAEAAPDADRLALAIDALNGVSPGTAATAVEHAADGGYVRRDGRVERVPAAWRTRRVDFGEGPRLAVTIPWGDVATAYHTTGVPNVETYAAVSLAGYAALRGARFVGPVLGLDPVRRGLRRVVRATVRGPDAAARERGVARVWGTAWREGGDRATARLKTPEAYRFTVHSAAAAVERTLAGEAPAGFVTPAAAFGAAFVDTLPDVEWLDRP